MFSPFYTYRSIANCFCINISYQNNQEGKEMNGRWNKLQNELLEELNCDTAFTIPCLVVLKQQNQ